jgi:2-keto-4-pentenoate hydratase
MTDIMAVLRGARDAARVADLEADSLPGTVAEAYEMVLPTIAMPAAWKIGGANPWSQKVFGNADPFFGALSAEEVVMEPDTVPLARLVSPLAEPEIALEIGDPEDPGALFSRMGLSIEVPASVLPDAAKPRLTGQIADRAGAGALWIGAVGPFDPQAFSDDFETEFVHNDADPVIGRASNVLFGGPLGAARRFLDLARDHGAPVFSGQWIATGGLTPAVPVSAGDSIAFSALGRTVRATCA